jgi:hypothetical protein
VRDVILNAPLESRIGGNTFLVRPDAALLRAIGAALKEASFVIDHGIPV